MLCLKWVLVNPLQGSGLLPGSEEETIFCCYLVPFAFCFMKVWWWVWIRNCGCRWWLRSSLRHCDGRYQSMQQFANSWWKCTKLVCLSNLLSLVSSNIPSYHIIHPFLVTMYKSFFLSFSAFIGLCYVLALIMYTVCQKMVTCNIT